MRLQGQHALVTGGGTGIGAATARALAAEGARITLIGRRREPLEIAATGTGFFATADVTDRAQVDRAFAEAREMQGPISILVNNAGAAESAPFAKLSAGQLAADDGGQSRRRLPLLPGGAARSARRPKRGGSSPSPRPPA